LKAVDRWIGEGGKATFVGAPDADILAAAIEILRKRIAAGTATFLVKVTAHRRELANEGADILADEAISDPKVGEEWCQRTNRAVFTWRKPCDDMEDCTHKQRYEASYQSMVKVLQQNTWIDDRKLLKSCVRSRAEQDNINHPAYGTWTADFMLQQNKSRAFLGRYLNDPRVPWRHKRREMMAIAGIIPVAKWLAKIKR